MFSLTQERLVGRFLEGSAAICEHPTLGSEEQAAICSQPKEQAAPTPCGPGGGDRSHTKSFGSLGWAMRPLFSLCTRNHIGSKRDRSLFYKGVKQEGAVPRRVYGSGAIVSSW